METIFRFSAFFSLYHISFPTSRNNSVTLQYIHFYHRIWKNPRNPEVSAPYWTRTNGLLLRRQLLYPAELKAPMERMTGIEPAYSAWEADALPLNYIRKKEAGDGNRTHVTSLEGWNSTIELHPHDCNVYYTTSSRFCQGVFRNFFCRPKYE